MMTPQDRGLLFERFAQQHPDPVCELHFSTPFQLLVAVVLSAQTTDQQVNLATAPLFKQAPTPQEIVALGQARLETYLKRLGLFRTKARHLIGLSEVLIARHGGAVPAHQEALLALPGVGRKSAHVVLNLAFGWPTIGVDTHLFRVAHRLGLASGKTPTALEHALVAITPPEVARQLNLWLVLHGRHVCQARRPRCTHCFVSDLCDTGRLCSQAISLQDRGDR